MLLIVAAAAALLGAVNLVQVVRRRQLFGTSRRPPQQLRRESALAALEMLGIVVACVGLQADVVLLAVAGGLLAVGSLGTIFLVRQVAT